MKKCLFCGKELQAYEMVCPACLRPVIPEQERVYSIDGREYGSHLSKEQQGLYNESFAKAFAGQPRKPGFCSGCGAMLREGSRFCPACGAPCAQVSGLAAAEPGKEKHAHKKLLILIAVLAAGFLLLAGILLGMLLGGRNSGKAERYEEEAEETRDRDDRAEEADGEESGGSLPGKTESYKVVAGTHVYYEDFLDNTVSYGYNEAGQLIFYERRQVMLENNYEEAMRFEYFYDEEGRVISADLTVDGTTVTFDYVYENGRVVSCSGTADGTTATFLYGTIDGGRILDIRMDVDGEEQEISASASYDGHGCLERVVINSDSGTVVKGYNCEGNVIYTEQHDSWSFTSTTVDYDQKGRMIARRQYRNDEQISETLYHYDDRTHPALRAMTVRTEDTVVEMEFEWTGSIGVWEGNPSGMDDGYMTRTVTLDKDGDVLSMADQYEDTYMENVTSYTVLELPAGQQPSDFNDLIYLHNLIVS